MVLETIRQMEYKGKLYGKIGNKYFDTSHTAEDWDKLTSRVKELEQKLQGSNTDSLHDVSHKLTLSDDNADLIDVTKRYGEKYRIEAVKGTKPDLSMMPLNQRVVYGDGIDYHFRLTKK